MKRNQINGHDTARRTKISRDFAKSTIKRNFPVRLPDWARATLLPNLRYGEHRSPMRTLARVQLRASPTLTDHVHTCLQVERPG